MSQARFGSRWALMLAMLGMAVGTGNIWRFPRIAGKNGGGEFLVAWFVFLLLWSVPLILLEFGLGRKTRAAPVRAFSRIAGPGWAWAGAFVVFVSVAITSYYSVVAGWTARYVVAAASGELSRSASGAPFWADFANSAWPTVSHAVMIGLAAVVVGRGVGAIEKASKILMPTLLILVAALVAKAVTLPGAQAGLAFLFGIDWSGLTRARVWIEALTQNAWSSGAGAGWALCYAAYQRERDDTALNGVLLPFANNAVSILAGIMVFCTAFAAVPPLLERAATDPEVLRGLGSLERAVQAGAPFSEQLMQDTIFSEDNVGITFVWMPELFRTIPYGGFFMALFFVALAVAAFTSLIAMVEMATRAVEDAGFPRRTAIRGVAAMMFLIGLPSALSTTFLENQDWVWGVALIISGLFFALAVGRHGPAKLRAEALNQKYSDIRIGRWWDLAIRYLLPCEAVVLLGWMLYQAWSDDPGGWLLPFDARNPFNVGTVLFQVGIAAALLFLFNRKLAASSGAGATSS